ncbi:MAG: N-acetyltransferase [Candidatus Lokiarchaeota archaeon]|nr:N-acetyltransferase [Candidatus Lokiarchaeota archaeon]
MIEGSNDIIKLNKNKLKKAAMIFSRAFQSGPIYMQFIPDDEKRRKDLHILFEGFVCYSFKYGKIYATSENLEGIMAILPSETSNITTWRMLRCGAWKYPLKFGLKFIEQGKQIDEISSTIHRRIAPDPHVYLWLLGVDPSKQGKGFGSKLLRYLLNDCKKKNLPCYLETGKKANLSFYEHFGFEVMEEYHFKDMNLTLWGLLWNKK